MATGLKVTDTHTALEYKLQQLELEFLVEPAYARCEACPESTRVLAATILAFNRQPNGQLDDETLKVSQPSGTFHLPRCSQFTVSSRSAIQNNPDTGVTRNFTTLEASCSSCKSPASSFSPYGLLCRSIPVAVLSVTVRVLLNGSASSLVSCA